MVKYVRTYTLTVYVFLLACIVSSHAAADVNFNMPTGVTAISRDIHHLHMTIFWICVVVGLIVFSVMLWSIIFHRKARGYKPSAFHESTWVEILWTSIPFLILVVMAIPATKTLINIYDADDADVDIKVTGYQWKWQYDYLEEDVSFFSNLATSQQEIYGAREKDKNYLLAVDEPLVVPTGKKIRFLITAADVIHSWWVPAFAVKKDAIPGFINEAWTRIDKPGIYRGQCAELCGKDHGFMPIVVDARPEAEYKKWLTEKKAEAAKIKELTSKDWSLEELTSRGEAVYNRVCVACHQSNGKGMPPMFPSLVKTPITMNKDFIADHISVVVNGVKGTAMQAFGSQLNEVDLAAVITYERNAWGNNTGEKITPKDILEFKKSGTWQGNEPTDGYKGAK